MEPALLEACRALETVTRAAFLRFNQAGFMQTEASENGAVDSAPPGVLGFETVRVARRPVGEHGDRSHSR